MRRFEVCGTGNAILDILVRVDEGLFSSLQLEKATMRLVSEDEQSKLLAGLKGRTLTQVSGGSVANSIIASAQLGARTALVCRLGDDDMGGFYRKECESLTVHLPNPLTPGRNTGTCVSMITPDAERTMRTCLAVSASLNEGDIPPEVIADSDWVFIEGYLLANGPVVQDAVRKVLEYAKSYGTKVAFTVSESWVVSSFQDAVSEVLSGSDLVFCNAAEACSLAECRTEDDAFDILADRFPGVALTAGARGAFVSWGGTRGFVEAFPCRPVDLTGAGDMFAGALLYGIAREMPLLDAARKACFLAGQVISRIGARLDNTKVLWDGCG